MTCYDPQGNVISGGAAPAYYPCNFTTSDGFVPCCQPDLGACLPNLACAYSDDVLIRGGCTDFTFRSKNCPQFLLESDPAGFGNFVHNCGNGTGCYNATVAHSDHNCSCAPGSPNLLLIFSNSIVYAETSSTSASSVPPAPVSTSKTTTTPTTISTTTHTSSTTISQITSSDTVSKSAFISVSVSAPVLSGTTAKTTSTPTSSDISSAIAAQSTSLVSPSSLVITGSATSTATASSQANNSNLGLKIGLPVGIVGGLALLLVVLAAFSWKGGFRGRKRDSVINSEPGLFIGDVSYRTKYN